jgi:hypothetical protein
MGIKMAQQINQWAPKGATKSISGSSLLRSLFSRNHSNYCAVGTSWLLKVICSMEIGVFVVLVAFRCALFYTTFV